MKLFIDDIRQAPDGWERRRTITDAIRLLHNGVVEELSLDHDICHGILGNDIEDGGHGKICTCPENYSSLAYVVAMMNQEFRPKKIYLHSANPHGRKNMKAILKDAGIESEERPIRHPWGPYVGDVSTEPADS